jgi:isopropylmalate/homocitrate/citramalate synthase
MWSPSGASSFRAIAHEGGWHDGHSDQRECGLSALSTRSHEGWVLMATSVNGSDRRIFSDDQVARMRKALDSFRTGPGFEPARWRVSDTNRRQDVLGVTPPSSVRVRDLTLRVSDQMSSVALSSEQRLRLLRAIVSAGISSVQLPGMGRRYTMEERRAEVDAARSINPEVELQVAVETTAALDLAREIGYDNVSFTSGTFLGDALPSYAGAVYHRAWQGRPWDDLNLPKSPAEVTERACRLVDAAATRGFKVKASILLLSYADDEYVASYCRSVLDAGATEVELGDHASGMSPEGFAHFTRVAHDAAPGLQVAIHSHGMFGVATAACHRAGLAGAEILEASINGFHDGPMQADLAEVVAGMEVLYGVDTGVDLAQLTPLSRLAESLMGQSRPGDWPVTGREVFDYGNDGDEYAQEFKVDSLIHMSLVPHVVGNEAHRRIGLTSGPWTMWDKLDELGIEAEQDAIEPILAACKHRMHELGRGLVDDEIRELASEHLAPTGRASGRTRVE